MIGPPPLFFRISVMLFVCIVAALFYAGLAERPLWPVTLAGGAALALTALLVGRQDLRGLRRRIAWPLLPFVWGMAATIRGLERTGLTAGLAHLVLTHTARPVLSVLLTGGVAALGANVFTNVPMALVMLGVLQGDPRTHLGPLVGATLVGVNIGPAVTPVGSLATMLWLAFTRRQGVDVPAREYLRVSLQTVPWVLVATLAAVVFEGALR